jgi:hypothetical protein
VPLIEVAPGAPAPKPIWPRWTDAEGQPLHTDAIPSATPDTCFVLPWAQLQHCRDPDGFAGHAMARRAVLLALRRLARKPLRGVPVAFTVFFDFCGSDRDQLVVGLSPSSEALDALLGEHLDLFPEVLSGEAARAWVGRDGLRPQWRSDHGQIIEYGDAELAGTQAVDGPEGLRTGLRLHRRVALRTSAQAEPAYGVLVPKD